jgi:D-glycero-alpha-D-manno-heptose-7-phosphate kinase
MLIRSKAPLRISFAGGGTDVMPYLAEQGGVILSTTINHYAYTSLKLSPEPSITVKSLDYDMTVKHNLEEPLPYDGNLDLIKAVINRLHLEQEVNQDNKGIEVFLHSDAPPGSGLGSSSTLVVSLIALFRRLHNLPLTHYEIADLAYQIERVDMGIKGGKQDQYAATFGGFNFIEFHKDATIVNPLRIDLDILNELDYNLLLCYTGSTRLSSGIIDSQVQNYIKKKPDVLAAMSELKHLTIELKNALLRGKLNYFGSLLHDAWLNKKKMADQISTPLIDELYETAIKNGALGGKITGAGGGGYMFFYCPFGTKRQVAQALEKLGAQVVDFNFDFHGVQTWAVR